MVLIRHADTGVCTRAELARHNHTENTRDVSAERQQLQVKHQLGVRVERIRDIDRPLWQFHGLGCARLRVLNALLDLAHGIQIFAELGAVPSS